MAAEKRGWAGGQEEVEEEDMEARRSKGLRRARRQNRTYLNERARMRGMVGGGLNEYLGRSISRGMPMIQRLILVLRRLTPCPKLHRES